MTLNKKDEIQMDVLTPTPPQPPPSYNSSNHYPIVYQPTVYSTNAYFSTANGNQSRIQTHLGWSILNTICCLCIGSLILFCSIPAMIFSFKTAEHLRNGNLLEAQTNSKLAQVFNTLATFLWIMAIIFGLFIITFYTTIFSAALYFNILNEQKGLDASNFTTIIASNSSFID